MRAPSSQRQAGTTWRATRREADPSISNPTLTLPVSVFLVRLPPGARHYRARLTCASELRCSAATSNSGQPRTPDSPPTERHNETSPRHAGSRAHVHADAHLTVAPTRIGDDASSYEQASQAGKAHKSAARRGGDSGRERIITKERRGNRPRLVSHLVHMTTLRRQRVVGGSSQIVATTSGKADTHDMMLQDVGWRAGVRHEGGGDGSLPARSHTYRRYCDVSDRHSLAQGRW